MSVPQLLHAQSPSPAATPGHRRYVFEPLEERLGLSTAAITSLAQDSRGFLWIGTQDGLVRYDGVNVLRFTQDDGLPATIISQVVVSPDGDIWAATAQGIARFDGKSFHTVPLPAAAALDTIFQPMALDRDHGLYLATSRGLLRLDTNDPTRYRLWTRKDGLPADSVDEVFFGDDGALYFLSGNRVGMLRRPDATPQIIATPVTNGSEQCIAVFLDHEHTIWVRTSNHVLRFDPTKALFVADDDGIPKANDFGAPNLDRSGELMVPTVYGLFRRVNNAWERIGEQQGLESDAVFSAMEDREGALWIGLGGMGLVRRPGAHTWSGWTKESGLPDDVIWCIARDPKGRLWVGTNNGLAMWDETQHRWRVWHESSGLAGDIVRDFALGTDGALWMTSVPGGLTRVDPRTLQATKIPVQPANVRPPVSLAVAPDGAVWVANEQYLKIVRRHGNAYTFQNVALPPQGEGTTAVPAFAPDGTFWSGGPQGIARFDGKTWSFYKAAQGIQPGRITEIVPVSSTEAWFRHDEPHGLGHIKLNGATAEIDYVTTREGLPANNIYFIGLSGNGTLWTGTGNGLAEITAAGQKRTFTRADGVIWDDLDANAFWSDPDGGIYFGTSRGLAHYQPDPKDLEPQHPNVLLTSVLLSGEKGLEKQDPTIRYAKNVFAASFTEMTFRDPQSIPCRYRMAGLESDFTESLTHEARYSSMPSGAYRFEVECGYMDGSWSAPVSYAFTIAPAWWESWWARLLELALAVLVIFAGIHIHTRKLQADRRRLEAAVATRSAELARANQNLAEAALTDPLTKTRNRRFFQSTIESDASQAVRAYADASDGIERRDLIFYLVDLDHFKEINDRFGHHAGDLALTQVAERLASVVRRSDTLIRWGGEEFLIVSRSAERGDAQVLATRILQVVGSTPLRLDSAQVRRTCSVGWVAFPWLRRRPEQLSVNDVLDLTDKALYLAKESGRNQAVGLVPKDEAGPDITGGKNSEWHVFSGEALWTVRSAGPESEATEAASLGQG